MLPAIPLGTHALMATISMCDCFLATSVFRSALLLASVWPLLCSHALSGHRRIRPSFNTYVVPKASDFHSFIPLSGCTPIANGTGPLQCDGPGDTKAVVPGFNCAQGFQLNNVSVPNTCDGIFLATSVYSLPCIIADFSE